MTVEEKAREFNSTFGINPSKEIIRGIDLELNVQAGDKIQTQINSVHDFAKDEQILFTLRIGAKSEEAGKTLKSTLEMLRGMAFGALPKLKEKLNVKFVLQKSSVYIYIMVKNDPSLEKLKTIISSYDLSNLHLNSRFNFNFRTRLSPADLLTEDFETLVEKFAQIKLSIASKIKFSIIAKFLSKFLDQLDERERRTMKVFIPIINFFRIMPKIESNIDYHEEECIAYMKDLGEIFPELEFEKLKAMVDGELLPKLRNMFEQAKSMFGEQAAGFKEAIEAIDFTEIHLSMMVKPLSFMVEKTIDIRGMDTVIDKFFN
jgi:molybdopterin converting factor small subunit